MRNLHIAFYYNIPTEWQSDDMCDTCFHQLQRFADEVAIHRTGSKFMARQIKQKADLISNAFGGA